MRKMGLNGGKSEKNRRIIGGWRTGPKFDKNRPKEKQNPDQSIKKKTDRPGSADGPVPLKKPPPLRFLSRVFSPALSLSLIPIPATQKPSTHRPSSPFPPHLLSLSTPFSLLQHNTPAHRIPQTPTPSTHGFPQKPKPTNSSSPTNTKPRHPMRWLHHLLSTIPPDRRVKSQRGFGYKEVEATPWKVS